MRHAERHGVYLSLTLLQVKQMSSEDTEHKDLFKRNLSHGSLTALAGQVDAEAEFTVSLQAASPQGVHSACSACRHPALFFS